MGRVHVRSLGHVCVLVLATLGPQVLLSCAGRAEAPFALEFVGHACFMANSGDGRIVALDPYSSKDLASEVGPFPEGLEADIVTVSHGHRDHSNVSAIGGGPEVLRDPGRKRLGDLRLTLLKGFEGRPEGRLSQNRNLVTVLERDGAKIVHMADAGLLRDPETLRAIAGADLVVVSIDDYVIPHSAIMGYMREIGARTVVPAHWESSDQLARFLALAGADRPVVRAGTRVEVAKDMPLQVLVMEPAADARVRP